MSRGPRFAEAMTAKIAKGLGLDTDLNNIVVEGAGGVGKKANGLYMPTGNFNGKPMYTCPSGFSVFYHGRWKIGHVDNGHPVWIYAAQDASGATPPTGAWTTWGYGRGDADPPPRLALAPPPDGVPLNAVFAWLFALQPPDALPEESGAAFAEAMQRVLERREHNTLREIVALLSSMGAEDAGCSLSPAHPGFFSAEGRCIRACPAAWLTSASGCGEWISSCGTRRGNFLISIATDLPKAVVRMKMDESGPPSALQEVPLSSCGLEYANRGASIIVHFTCAHKNDFANAVHFKVALHAAGSMEGQYRSSDQFSGTIVGRTTGEYRQHSKDLAVLEGTPWSAMLGSRQNGQAQCVDWTVPQAVVDGRVRLVAIGGAEPGARNALVRHLLRELGEIEVRGTWVAQGDHQAEHLAGARGFPSPPNAVDWRGFLQEIDSGIAEMVRWASKKRFAVVFVEGPLVYCAPALAAAFQIRFFLLTSRLEVRRNFSAVAGASGAQGLEAGTAPASDDTEKADAERPAADAVVEAAFEHVVWPAHLAFGQTHGQTHALQVRDGRQPLGGLAAGVMEQAANEMLAEFHRSEEEKGSPR